jgi:glycosyltransferase involved in cell wall biosynthesis
VAKLSMCLITKDEGRNIAACIESVSEAVDEIILVDTGSKDDTVRIAARYGARIYEFPWSDDFAAAKNETLKHATGDWVLALDADERLDPANCEKIRQLLENPAYQAYMLQLRSPYTLKSSTQGINTTLAIRLFQNTIGLSYHGRLHERILARTAKREISVANTNITIDHLGYQGNIEPKYRRNLSVSQRQKTKHDAFFRYDMARSYMGLGQYPEAMKELKQGLEVSGTAAWLRAQMYVLLGDLLIYINKDTESALTAWQQAMEIDQKIVAPRLRSGKTYYLRGEFEMASRQFESITDLLSRGSLRGALLDDECTLAEAYASLCICYIRAGHRGDAADALVKSRVPRSVDETVKVVPWNSSNELR